MQWRALAFALLFPLSMGDVRSRGVRTHPPGPNCRLTPAVAGPKATLLLTVGTVPVKALLGDLPWMRNARRKARGDQWRSCRAFCPAGLVLRAREDEREEVRPCVQPPCAAGSV